MHFKVLNSKIHITNVIKRVFKTNFKCRTVNWIHLAQDRIAVRDLLNALIEHWVAQNAVYGLFFLRSC